MKQKTERTEDVTDRAFGIVALLIVVAYFLILVAVFFVLLLGGY